MLLYVCVGWLLLLVVGRLSVGCGLLRVVDGCSWLPSGGCRLVVVCSLFYVVYVMMFVVRCFCLLIVCCQLCVV